MKSSAVICVPSFHTALGLMWYTTVCGDWLVTLASVSRFVFSVAVDPSGDWSKVLRLVESKNRKKSAVLPLLSSPFQSCSAFSTAQVILPPLTGLPAFLLLSPVWLVADEDLLPLLLHAVAASATPARM